MKLISWNIDSLNAALTSESPRSVLTRAVLDTLKTSDADVIAVQETKLPETGPSDTHLRLLKERFPDYRVEWASSVPPAKKGYAGTMVLVRDGLPAVGTAPAIGAPDTMDCEGRILSLEFDTFHFVNVYTPNAGDGLKRLADRQEWDRRFAAYLSALDRSKPVVVCGDFNVAHEEIDLAHPESNHESAGFTDEEREGFGNLLACGFTDSFRSVHGPVKGVYSWWSQRIRTAKLNNAGWRIDYFLVSDRIADRIVKSEMLDSGERADHAPILLELDI